MACLLFVQATNVYSSAGPEYAIGLSCALILTHLSFELIRIDSKTAPSSAARWRDIVGGLPEDLGRRLFPPRRLI